MNEDDLKKRTAKFAHRCVKLSLALPNTVLGNHIKGQLIKCSTSAAANYRAVCLSQSKPGIVIEETDEMCFRMQSIIDEKLLKEQRIRPLLWEGRELTSIFISSRKTARGLRKE